MTDGALFWSWMGILNRQRYEALLEVYASLDEARKHMGLELLRGLGCKSDALETHLLRAEEFQPETYRSEIRRLDLQFLELRSEEYPERLAAVPDAPPFLYARGDLGILRAPCIALVGTRECTRYGRQAAELFSSACARSGVTTVSGLARGIDAAVAEETLREKGRTVAVLGHGLAMIYPEKHEELAERIVREGGLLLSEFPLDQEPAPRTFPSRNRIIAGLSLATIVIEAPEGSGALITADLALDYNREVYAVPGPITEPTFAGGHRFIGTARAKLASSPEAVFADLGIIAPTPEQQDPPEDPGERAVWEALDSLPRSVDDLAGRTGKSIAEIQAILTILELQGRVRAAGEGMWVRG